MNEQPLISIIVPVYNTEMYLDKCVTSLINQTYRNIEIILVDDGSTDNSGKMCDSYVQKDNRIKVIHQTNAEVGAARNVGLKNVSGQYIGFVDSDDYVEHDMYEVLLKTLLQNNVSIVSCSYFYEKQSDFTIKEGNSSQVLCYSSNEYIYYLIKDKKYHNYMWNKLFERNLFYNINFPNIGFREDLAILCQLVFKSGVCACIEIPKYHYRINPNGATNSRKLSWYYDSMKAKQIRLSTFPNDIDTEIRELAVCKLVQSCIQIISHRNAFPSTFHTKRVLVEAYQALQTYHYNGHMNADYRIKLFFIKHSRKKNSLIGCFYALSLKK